MILSHLAHDRAGSGEPVVLLHGIGHRRGAWDPVFESLAKSFDVIACDLAGFGDSPAFPAGKRYSMENACIDLAANFADWGLDRPHVVGNSLGGALGLELASRGLVSSVTALSPAGFFGRFDLLRALVPLSLMWVGSHAPDRVLRAIADTTWGRRAIGFPLYAHPDRATAQSTYADASAMKHGKGFLPTAMAAIGYRFERRVQVPTTIAWGTADRLLPYRQSRRARRRLPLADHVALTGCGHVPMLDAPEEIVELVSATVARAAGPGGDSDVA